MTSPSSQFDADAAREEEAWRVRSRSRSRRRPEHHPRVRAAVCYAVPVIPGCVLLWRERENRFVRFHAAQSLVFFGLVAASQITLYLLLILAGGLIQSDRLALLAAAALTLLFVTVVAVMAYTWLQLLADCIGGRARRLPVAGAWAARIERAFPGAARTHRRGRKLGAG
jgi:uncharacterized membrane protein